MTDHDNTFVPRSGLTSTDAHPQVLGDYRLLEKLGQGGMGTVYKAEHTRLGKHVAVKLLAAESTSDPAAVARFQREMKAVGQLQHPNIIQAMDAREEYGLHFLVLALVQGVDLDELRGCIGAIRLADAADIISQAAEGLQHAHDKGLVHRDIKPSNLLLSSDGVIKVLDLGLALLVDSERSMSHLTNTGQIMGTLDYIAPEQADDTHRVDIRADIYSLGCTFYTLLAGEPPFSGERFTTPLRKITAHLKRPVPSIRKRRRDVPESAEQVLKLMLAKKPDDRFQSPWQVVHALDSLKQGSDLRRLANKAATRIDTAKRSTEHNVVKGSTPQETNPEASPGRATATRIRPATADKADVPDIELAARSIKVEATRVARTKRRDRRRQAQRKPAPSSRRHPSVKWIAAALAGLALLLSLIVVKIKDKDGNVVATVKVPEGGSYEVDDTAGPNSTSNRSSTDRETPVSAETPTTEPKAVSVATPERVVEDTRVATADAQTDRAVAEWILGIGGRVTIEETNSKVRKLVRVPEQLPAGSFHLRTIYANQCKQLTDAEMWRLARLRHLIQLDAASTPITDAGLVHLENLTTLQNINLQEAGNGGVTDAGVAALSNLTNLKVLGLHNQPITTRAFEHLRGCKQIQRLYIQMTRINDESLRVMAQSFPQLELLQANSNDITDEGVRHLLTLPHLSFLNLSRTSISDAAIEVLAGLPELRHLQVNSTACSFNGLSPLADSESLEIVDSTGLSGDLTAVERLRKASPELIVLTNERDRGLSHALGWGESVSIELPDGTQRELNSIKDFPTSADYVVRVITARNREISGFSLKRVTKGATATINALHLPGCGFQHRELEVLAELPQLTRLNLARAHLHRDAVESIAKAKGLQALDLTGADIPPAELEYLRKSLPDCEITTDELEDLNEWLAGRQILTVAQDGSGEYKTIQSAVDALKPGQVVEVLDPGPYEESLDLTPPHNTGLISRSRTSIRAANWTRTAQTEQIGHAIRGARSFRLHGFRFGAEQFETQRLVRTYDCANLLVEECDFVAPISRRRTPDGLFIGTRDEGPVTVRNCTFLNVRLAIRGGNAVVRHNLFSAPRSAVWITAAHSIRVDHNVIRARNAVVSEVDSLTFEANTLLAHPDSDAGRFTSLTFRIPRA